MVFFSARFGIGKPRTTGVRAEQVTGSEKSNRQPVLAATVVTSVLMFCELWLMGRLVVPADFS